MPSLLIKSLPEDIHRRLKESAVKHRRSMTQEAVVALSRGLNTPSILPLPPLVRLKTPLTQAFIDKAIRRGRA